MSKTKYQQEMDAIHLSEEKTEQTLEALLAENRRLRVEDAKREQRRGASRRPLYAVVAAAACLLLVVGGIAFSRRNAVSFGAFQLSSLPVSVARDVSVSGGAASFAEAFGRAAQTLFPGAEITYEDVAADRADGGYTGYLTVVQNGFSLNAEVSAEEPPIYGIARAGRLNGKALRLAREETTGALYAVYQREGLYVVLSSRQLEEEAFLKAVGALI
ncbi:MAG: hypothetical protein IJ240_00790 [Clostridia bacterium]|nr:hypothetical protein [Clostridia bacterium]